MTTYLAIITTALVITQIVRVIQNAISLYRQEKKIEQAAGWLKDNEVKESDFETQRAVYRLLFNKLVREEQAKVGGEQAEEGI